MRKYDYIDTWQQLLTPDIVLLLTQIHEFKGRQNLFIKTKSDSLTQLLEVAKIQSTAASNRIEGIYTSDERLKKLVKDKTTPCNRDEQEIAGYRDVLTTIHDNHEFIFIKPSFILQLHRDLYQFSGVEFGGKYKNTNNSITEVDEQGNERIRFEPLEAWETPHAMEQICKAYETASSTGKADQLLIIPMFILDFLCIHPFNDGNGRMSRLLTMLLMYRAGYIVGKYISIEKLIEKSKVSYYEALEQSSYAWHEGKNNYQPFIKYLLGIILAAYREFEARVDIYADKNPSKPEQIAELIKNTWGKITKQEILDKCPHISNITVQRTLNELQQSGEIIKLGGGRYTSYTWNRERE